MERGRHAAAMRFKERVKVFVCVCVRARVCVFVCVCVCTGTLLVPQEPFELLVRRSILALLPPALMCKDLVYEELLHIAEQTCPNEAVR